VDGFSLNRLGIARGQKGDWQGAFESFDQAVALDPECAQAHNNRGIARQRLGQGKPALADFNRAIELEPRYAEAYSNRGTARQADGDLDGAIADFDRAVAFASEQPSAGTYHNRGTARRERGDDAGALADFTEALRIDPQLAVSYQARGVVRHRLGLLDEALADFERAFALTDEAQAAPIYHGRGGVKVTQGDLKGALADYNRALEIDPRYHVAYVSRAHVRYHLRDLAGYVDYRRAYALHPDGTVGEILRALVEAVKLDAEAVLLNCRKHLRINPNDAVALARRGLTLILLGRESEAHWDFEELLAYRQESSHILRHLIRAAGAIAVKQAQHPPTPTPENI
jgi:tetratricopeptide (TPR) repeat protein